jgi:serine/threonine protein kinase
MRTQLLDVFTHREMFHFVFPLYAADLEHLVGHRRKTHKPLTQGEIKVRCVFGHRKHSTELAVVQGFMVQILAGLDYLHRNWIVHRVRSYSANTDSGQYSNKCRTGHQTRKRAAVP